MSKHDMITIEAEYIRETPKSFYLDCEGDLEWFPKKSVEFDKEKNELKCPRWLLKEKFPGEKY